MPLKLTLIAVGKTKNKHLSSIVSDFEKKLSRYIKFAAIETKDVRRSKLETNVKGDEARLIEAKLPDGAYIVALDERGKLRTTAQLANWWSGFEKKCINHVVFVIGGPDGLDESIVSRANELVALSPMTFTHEMARFIVTEQMYRVLSFNAGHPYHRE